MLSYKEFLGVYSELQKLLGATMNYLGATMVPWEP